MYEIDKKPNSDEAFCENCECLVDEKMITETIDGEPGCTECISKCGWCGNYYFRADMFADSYLGYCCDACLNAEDYMKASEAEILKDALRHLFDSTKDKRVEKLIIKLARKKEYYKFADELNNDKS